MPIVKEGNVIHAIMQKEKEKQPAALSNKSAISSPNVSIAGTTFVFFSLTEVESL